MIGSTLSYQKCACLERTVLLKSIPVLVMVGNNTAFHQLKGREGLRM